jgi:hypothetical protein
MTVYQSVFPATESPATVSKLVISCPGANVVITSHDNSGHERAFTRLFPCITRIIGVGVADDVAVGVDVIVDVFVGVMLGSDVKVIVCVGVCVIVGVNVAVGVDVSVGCAVVVAVVVGKRPTDMDVAESVV